MRSPYCTGVLPILERRGLLSSKRTWPEGFLICLEDNFSIKIIEVN
jgi:hypothetical protein